MFCWLVVVLVGGQLDSGGKGRRRSTAEGCFPPTRFLAQLSSIGQMLPHTQPCTQMWPLLPAMLESNLYSHVCFHGAQMSVLCVFKAELLLAMTRIQMLLLSVGPFSSLEH